MLLKWSNPETRVSRKRFQRMELFEMFSLALLFVIASFTSECACRNLPSYFPKCCMNDPQLNECLLNATKTLRPYIRKGIKEVGIPSYAPITVSNFGVKQDSQLVSYAATLKDLSLRGMDDYDFTDFRYDPTTTKFSGEISFHPVFLNTVYDVSGSMLSIPIEGKGQGQASIGPINSTFVISGNMTKHNDKEYYNPTDIKFKFSADDMSIYLEGLFGGNDELASTTNKLLNQNSKLLINAVTPALASVTESFLARYIKWLFRAFPFEELFPSCK